MGHADVMRLLLDAIEDPQDLDHAITNAIECASNQISVLEFQCPPTSLCNPI